MANINYRENEEFEDLTHIGKTTHRYNNKIYEIEVFKHDKNGEIVFCVIGDYNNELSGYGIVSSVSLNGLVEKFALIP